MGLLSNLWDRSIFNRVIVGPDLLYHGTTITYYNKEQFIDYYKHSGPGGVWFEKSPEKAMIWAVHFATEYRDKPVLVVVNAKKLVALRRNFLMPHQGIWRPPFFRADNIIKKFAVMVKLEFKEGKAASFANLTDSCKNDIARAQARAKYL